MPASRGSPGRRQCPAGFLAKLGHDVIEATTGDEAMAALRADGGSIW